MSHDQGDEEERSCLVLYASQTGNSEDIAHGIGRMLERMHIKRRVCAMDQCDLMDLMNENYVIFVASTTGQGDIPDNMKLFWPAILRRSLPPTLLDHLSFALFGLGDSSYPKYNFTAKKLYRRLIQLGARPMVERGEGDESHPQGIDAGFAPWLKDLRQVMEVELPLPSGLETIPDDQHLPPTYKIQFGENAPSMKTASPRRLGLTFSATVTKNDRITADDHWQDARHIVFSISAPDLAYDPGDIAVLWPENPRNEVDRLIEVCKWQNIADTPLDVWPKRNDDEIPPLPTPCTLRTLARYHFDFMSVPKRSFFELLRHFVTNEMHAEKLTEFCGTTSDNQEDLWDYTTRPRRNILEVLADFKETLSIPVEYVLDLFPMLKPRQYSLASSLKAHPGEAHILAAIVEYKTSMHIPRVGVSSRWLQSLKLGTQVTMGLIRGAMKPPRKGIKCVMVAPGTGVAPMRALVQERVASGCDAKEQLLIFGNREREKDFLMRAEWEEYEAKGQLSLALAFSRDTTEKFYVQHVLRREWRRVDTWLRKEGGYVYICGSSGKMPQAVREALIEIFQRGIHLERGEELSGSGARDEAEAVLVEMETKGRYLQETW
ncbi:NADPH-dependent FMN and FAD containing oxidoreductase-like protein [Saitoella complicata NRRL Y-17804]|nr:NADPH-dependent FMN and FAD containing oxidoreductase-like protein [Saitoella complicata NRRL Y-17804]ODQ54393.1 NADPH-dependent FMN and FAD containing oxidoreductase-like protein [Saitoella complicata NRRL Y-17804]